MDAKTHWENVYATKAPQDVSWYRPHLERSLALIEEVADARSGAIIDIGGGESTLVDDLLLRGYKNITILDVSQTAIDVTKKRLGSAAGQVSWIVGDVTEIEAEPRAYDVWHDRAVFHFLTVPGRRIAYVRQVVRAVKRGGHVIVSTFGPEHALATRCPTYIIPVALQRQYTARNVIRGFAKRTQMMTSCTLACLVRATSVAKGRSKRFAKWGYRAATPWVGVGARIYTQVRCIYSGTQGPVWEALKRTNSCDQNAKELYLQQRSR